MSILNSNKPEARLGRSAFDLSSTHAFSMRPAVLRPVIVQDTVPDSAFRIKCSDLVRTSALQTAAFLRGKHELDFFFVPYSLVYSYFNDIVLQRGDAKSPIMRDIEPEDGSLPSLPLEHLYYNAMIPYLVERFVRHMFAYSSNINITLPAWLDGINGSVGLQQKFMNMCLYNTFDLNVQRFDLSYYSFVGYDCLAMLDTLGYGNFGATVVSMVDKYLSASTSDVGDWVRFWIELWDTSIDLIKSYFNNQDFAPESFSTGKKLVNPLRLFAYQKIFYDRYRDEVFDNSPLYAYAVSADFDFESLSGDPIQDLSTLSRTPLETFLRPRVRMVKKDIVSGLYPSAQFGNMPVMTDFSEMSELNVPFSNPPEQPMNISSGAPNIRFVLAMQKYRETLLRAGSRSKDVLKALFGVESRYIDDTYVRYIGSFSGLLELNKVSATAEGGSYSVGDIAGNVFSSITGDTIEFTCNDYGVIVGVMSFFPEVMHNNYGVNPHVLKTRPLQFFKAAFEDLGLQPVSSSVVSLLHPTSNGATASGEFTLGFSARYNEYKQNLDFSHDQFGTANLPLILENVGFNVNPLDGFNSNYVVTRPVTADVSWSSLRNYLLPNCMDSLFASLDTGDISNYHFDVILDCSINAVLPMSNLGLPY